MSIGQMTVADAASGIFWALLKGMLWAVSMRLAAYFFDVEWTWRIFAVCAVTSLAECVIYARYTGAVGGSGNG